MRQKMRKLKTDSLLFVSAPLAVFVKTSIGCSLSDDWNAEKARFTQPLGGKSFASFIFEHFFMWCLYYHPLHVLSSYVICRLYSSAWCPFPLFVCNASCVLQVIHGSGWRWHSLYVLHCSVLLSWLCQCYFSLCCNVQSKSSTNSCLFIVLFITSFRDNYPISQVVS